MIQSLFDDLVVYFNAKENPTKEEQQFKNRLSEGYFPITSVHRDDLKGQGFDVEKISDSDMKKLAEKMANDYCEQLFWSSMEIIAEDILNFPKVKDTVCPQCQSKKIHYDLHEGVFHCDDCSLAWDDKLYVLVEFPEDNSSFEEEEIGYPSWESEDNGAVYVPIEDYIRHFGKSPEQGKCYRPLRWPDSQQYMDREDCELIQDEQALENFGPSAYWVPLSLLQKDLEEENKAPICPECGSTDIDILGDEGVAICNNCHLEWPHVED